MLFSVTSLSAVLALASTAIASPVEKRAADVPAKYHLKTKVVDTQTSTGTNKDGLYLFSYHTGAGLGVGGLAVTPPEQWYTYNGPDNQVYFTYDGSLGPWPLQVDSYGPYQAWVPLSISVSKPSYGGQGFVFDNEAGLVYNNTNNGWLACDWWHSTPELFLLQTGYTTSHPESCSRVELHPVSLDE